MSKLVIILVFHNSLLEISRRGPNLNQISFTSSAFNIALENRRHFSMSPWVFRKVASEKNYKDSILMTYHNSDKGRASDWLKICCNQSEALSRSGLVTRHQYGISALVLRRHLAGKPCVESGNVEDMSAVFLGYHSWPYPKFSWSATEWAKLTFLHQIEADSPYVVALTASMTSPEVRNGINLTFWKK